MIHRVDQGETYQLLITAKDEQGVAMIITPDWGIDARLIPTRGGDPVPADSCVIRADGSALVTWDAGTTANLAPSNQWRGGRISAVASPVDWTVAVTLTDATGIADTFTAQAEIIQLS